MTHPLAMFDRVAIINLPDRADRRREMTREIERIGGFDHGRIAFFEATRPADAGDFPSIGARGCFMSQLGVLRQAWAEGVESVLILEDDFDFTQDFATTGKAKLERLTAGRWDILYGAYVPLDQPLPSFDETPIDPRSKLMLACFVALRRPAMERAIACLEGMLTRPLGSPDYGPMHVDGAYNVLREQNPDLLTVAANPQLGGQRSSRSDISDHPPLIDRLPILRPLATLARRLRRAAHGR